LNLPFLVNQQFVSHLRRILTLAVRLTDNPKTGEASGPFVLSLLIIVRSMVIHHRYIQTKMTIFGPNGGLILLVFDRRKSKKNSQKYKDLQIEDTNDLQSATHNQDFKARIFCQISAKNCEI